MLDTAIQLFTIAHEHMQISQNLLREHLAETLCNANYGKFTGDWN